MSEIVDWKQKYRDSLLEMEKEETRWRQLEHALRRLVGRLCAAGMGIDLQLDDQLKAVAAANRRNGDAKELEQLASSLTSTVVAVDAVSPVPTVILAGPAFVRWDATCASVALILNRLRAAAVAEPAVADLIMKLPRVHSDATLAVILGQIAQIIQAHGETLANERQQAAAVFSDVTKRLEEMADYLTESSAATSSRFADSTAVNDTVMGQVRQLSAESHSATELSALQSSVSERLTTVAQQVMEFRSREEHRQHEMISRTDRMRARITDLELETQDLHSKLDREKHGARLDPLTQLANRKSFDERFAEEVERRSQTERPVAVLLWDLDNFKIINDTYGHRAGDRVLQSVAHCFMSGLRAGDFVARIGGEEFVVLLTGISFEHAQQIANQLRTSVAELRFHFRGTPVRVTISCGLTELRSNDEVTAAFDRADGALYQAKHDGKNLCVSASDMET